ncbi:MAG: hypothetical protein QW487_02270 [Candidatus Bathyarchaeia archaeon]|nr:hypothetical protein [Candidatus Bathyarchaeota archaeon]
MKVYEVELKQESPFLISGITSESRFLKHSFESINGFTIRGALLTYISKELGKEVKEEVKNPSMIFHPAYLKLKGVVSRPLHPLLLSCKLCKGRDKIFPLINRIEDINKFDINRASKIVCKKGHMYAITPVKGLAVKLDGAYYKVSFIYQPFDFVAINKYLKSSEIGMLFGYLAVLPVNKDGEQNVFIGKMIDTQERLEKMLNEEEFELNIGRGKSKGFGRFKAKLKPLDDYINKREKAIRETLKKTGGVLVLRALSPSFGLDIGDDGVITSNLTLEFDATPYMLYEGKNYIVTGIQTISGFSLKVAHGGLPKPRITGAEAGSLFFYNIPEEKAREVAMRELTGFGPMSYGGLNILEVMEDV